LQNKQLSVVSPLNNSIIDIGVNITNKRFDKDRDEVIQRAKSASVSGLLITGTNIEESQKALALCEYYQITLPYYLHCTAGVHPHDADHVGKNYLEKLNELALNPHVKAIGECGLDFNRNFSEPRQQQKVFSEQVRLAVAVQKPLFLHQRDAFEPWLATLSPYIDKVPAMVSHCFTGNKDQLLQCLAANMYIGITGWLCDERRGQALQDIIKLIPLDRLLIETDAPYLTPRTIRPKPKSSRNEPSYLPYIIREIARITGLDQEQIAWQTNYNSKQVFNFVSNNDLS
jgi:TatD DNase family protein